MNAGEAARHRRTFTNRLWVLGTIDVYWLPQIRRIAARCPHARIKIPLPADACYVGRYAYPLAQADDFIDDLADCLRRHVVP